MVLSMMLLGMTASTWGVDPYSLPGPFAWSETSVVVPSTGPGGTQTAKLYYPATTSGPGNPISPTGGPFPVVTFGHGFVVPPLFYDSFLRQLATRGYVAIATDSQVSSFNPDRLQYVADMKSTVDYVIAQNGTPGSILEGRIDTNAIGASGHSLGGGIATLMAAQDNRVKALATFSAATLRSSGPLGPAPPPYADVAVTTMNIPVSFINGSLDQLIPVPTNGQVLYDAASGPKLLPNVVGGYHVGFTDFAFPPPFGDFGQPGSITMEENQAFGRAELTSFFDLYLKGDQSAWRRQWGPERLAQVGVLNQLDPGFTISADSSLTGLAGTQVPFSITVKNTSDHADQYALFAEDNAWDVLFSVPVTPTLLPGDSYTLSAWVNVPSSPLALQDIALVSARSELDGGTRAFTYVTTAIPESSWLAGIGFMSLLTVAATGRLRKVTL